MLKISDERSGTGVFFGGGGSFCFPLLITTSALHTNLSPAIEDRESSHQRVHYHISCFNVGATCLLAHRKVKSWVSI
jgi:hypothetical protein